MLGQPRVVTLLAHLMCDPLGHIGTLVVCIEGEGIVPFLLVCPHKEGSSTKNCRKIEGRSINDLQKPPNMWITPINPCT